MPRIRALLSALFALFFLASADSARAKVGGMTLKEMIKYSAYIVVARVESVKVVDGIRVARAVPQQEFKGERGQKPFYFVAEGTWRCDTSTAVEGETVLLFLSRIKDNVVKRDMIGKPVARVKVEPLFSITHSGRGRMPVRIVEGKTYVTLWTGGVSLPRSMKSIPGEEKRYSSFRSVLLSDIVQILSRLKPALAAR
jgi:hypothetical protein